jgi:hypothetical protein
MWSRKPRMTRTAMPRNIRIVMPKLAMTTVFDECDHFTEDETGGRVIGTYAEDRSGLTIKIEGIIEPGPSAKRSAVSFFQDGAYQEGVFRKVEEDHPEIEHLGNWHTHHVNGYPQLSGGDIETYTRTVNHPNHNIDFFYALLVTAKNRGARELQRYDFKHYVFRRSVPGFVEVPPDRVEFVDGALVWPVAKAAAPSAAAIDNSAGQWPGRVADRDVLGELFESFRSFTSPQIGFYWRGKLELADETTTEVVVLENQTDGPPTYGVMLPDPSSSIKRVANQIQASEFSSARQALVATERALNRALFAQSGKRRR